jgi:hypothetical protein
MSLLSYFTDTEDQDSQDARLALQKQQYQDALNRRIAAGTIAADQARSDQDYVNNLQDESVSQAFTDALFHPNADEAAKPGIGDIFVDLVMLALAAGGAWLFWSMGGFIFLRSSIQAKNWPIVGGSRPAVLSLPGWSITMPESSRATWPRSRIRASPSSDYEVRKTNVTAHDRAAGLVCLDAQGGRESKSADGRVENSGLRAQCNQTNSNSNRKTMNTKKSQIIGSLLVAAVLAIIGFTFMDRLASDKACGQAAILQDTRTRGGGRSDLHQRNGSAARQSHQRGDLVRSHANQLHQDQSDERWLLGAPAGLQLLCRWRRDHEHRHGSDQ